jgi:hypothetical protein
MEKCIFCDNPTSFKYEGDGEYANKIFCPKCQAENLGTDFNTGCANEDDCSIKLDRKQEKF